MTRPPIERLCSWLSTLAALLFLAACAATPAKPVGQTPADDANAPRRLPPPKLAGLPGLPSVVIAELADGRAELLFARHRDEGMLVIRRKGRWLAGSVKLAGATAVGKDNADRGMLEVAPAPTERTPAALVADAKGYLLTWASSEQAGSAVWLAELDRKGKLRGKPRQLTRTFEPVAWLELLVHAGKGYVVWELSRGEESDLGAVSLAPGAQPVAALAQNVVGWDAALGDAGLSIAYVDDVREGRGSVALVRVGNSGKPSKAIAVSAPQSALGDVQIADLSGGSLLAWTDASSIDHHVMTAQVTAAGKASQAVVAVPPVGGQALVTLVASNDGRRALMGWEQIVGTDVAVRRVQLGLVGPDGKLREPRAELELHGASAPHVVADGTGFAALTLAPMQPTGDEPSAGNVAPSYVRLDGSLTLRASAPIRVDPLAKRGGVLPGVPQQVHELSCAANSCTVLARSSGKPTLVMLVTLPARSSGWRAAAHTIDPASHARATALEQVATVDAPIAELDAAKLRDGRSVVAWITHVGAESASEPSPPEAKLQFRFVSADGALGPVHTLSERAVSVGGVAVHALPETAGKRKEEGLFVIGWAGPNAGSNQVYVTKIGADGKKVTQKTVTKIRRNKRGELPNQVHDVDVVSDGEGGLICAWADTRDGDFEIYVARLNRQLEKEKAERRLTKSAGVSSEVSLALSGERLMVAWSDAREATNADVYAAVLNRDSLEPMSAPHAVDTSEAHSRTPRWIGASDSLALAWIDEPLADTPGAVRLVAVAADGQRITAVRRIGFGDKHITSLASSCNAKRCRGLVSSYDDTLHLGIFDTARESGAPLAVDPLASLAGGSDQDLSLTASDSSLSRIFFTRDVQGGAELRQLSLSW